MAQLEPSSTSDLLVRRFRMRELDVTFEAATPALDVALGHLVNLADDDIPTARRVTFTVAPTSDGRIGFSEDGEPARTADEVKDALVRIHRRLGALLFAIHDGLTSLHSGAVSIDGRLVILTGDRGAGKTTLLLRLALDGADFHCDEHVMASDAGLVRTLPRRLHVKPGTLACLPAIAEACLAHPMLQLPGGVAFYPLDIAELGLSWRSADRRPSAIVHLTPSFGGPPAITSIPQIEMVRRLFEQAMTSHADLRRQSANVAGVVRGVPCFSMTVGDLETSASTIRNVMATLPATC